MARAKADKNSAAKTTETVEFEETAESIAKDLDKTEKVGKDGKTKKVKTKAEELADTLAEIGKRFGPEAIMRLGSDNIVKCEAISTGSLTLDAAIGIGGVPKGRIVEFYGPESSGKTTLALQCIANSQKNGGTAAFIDAEHALDPSYAKKLGIDLDSLLVSQPDCGEQALDICEMLVKSNAVDIIVVDSVAALTPKAELEGEMGQSHVGLQARLMSQGLRKLTGIVKKSNSCIVFINQIRMKIGQMFGNPETTTGGNALKFYASVRLDIRRGAPLKKGDECYGNETKVKVVKNKMAPPFKTAAFQVLFNQGVNKFGEMVDLGSEMNIITKAGSWFAFGDTRIGQGRENAMSFLKDNPDIAKQVEERINQQLLDNVIPLVVPKEFAPTSGTDETSAAGLEETSKEDEAGGDTLSSEEISESVDGIDVA